jgi:hypothetical protein
MISLPHGRALVSTERHSQLPRTEVARSGGQGPHVFGNGPVARFGSSSPTSVKGLVGQWSARVAGLPVGHAIVLWKMDWGYGRR